jgi:UDP-N-acetylmuramoylalanine-D-glutamate ligase
MSRVHEAASLEEAIGQAAVIARNELDAGGPEPATVLLSPAATSFDMFVDYAARGAAFKSAVARLRQ